MSIENNCRFEGYLGADPEARFTQGGTCVCNFRMGVTKKFTKDGEKNEDTQWPRFVAWGRKAEIINQYTQKGTRMIVEGEYQERKWQDRDGNDRYTTEFVVQDFKILEGFREGGQQSSGNSNQSGGNSLDDLNREAGKFSGGNDPFADAPDFGDVPVDDDIPF